MNKKIITMVLCAAMLISVTGCGLRHRYPKVLIDTHPTYPINEIDIGDKYEYVHFDLAETDTGKDVIVHFERRTDEPDE